MTYESVKVVESAAAPGVTFTVAKMSFARRIELMRQVRELARRAEYLDAGSSPDEKMEAALLEAEIDRLYLVWGLREVTGLELDGQEATPESLAERGPEELFREALAAVRAETGLSEAEKKKLIVAFHFQLSNQAGWECDACRKVGLEKKRRCGFAAAADSPREGAPPVWARKGVALAGCPKSHITAESTTLVEEFLIRRRVKGGFAELSAREAEAFAILEELLEGEIRDGRKCARETAR